MRELSFVIAIPLTVLAYNISMKMDSRNIDQLIQGILIALIVLAVVVPTGLYVLAYLRDRRAQRRESFGGDSGWNRSMTGPQRDISARHANSNAWGAPPPTGYWHTMPLPPPYQAPTQPQGSFILQQPLSFQQEDWS